MALSATQGLRDMRFTTAMAAVLDLEDDLDVVAHVESGDELIGVEHRSVVGAPYRSGVRCTSDEDTGVMISVWILLDNEPPMTLVSVGVDASFSCRWYPFPPPGVLLPDDLLSAVTGLELVAENGSHFVRASGSAQFVAYVDLETPGDAVAATRGVVVEDRSLWVELDGGLDSMPSFTGRVVDIRYLWTPTNGAGEMTTASEQAANDLPGEQIAAGKIVRVKVA